MSCEKFTIRYGHKLNRQHFTLQILTESPGEDNKTFRVEYYATHCGHQGNALTMRLTKVQNDYIHTSINCGASTTNIMNSIISNPKTSV